MANRPTLGRIWSSSGLRKDPGEEKYALGWLAEIPTYEVLNYLQYKLDLALAALTERGIPEWGSDVSYVTGSVAWDNLTNKIYVALVDNPDRNLSPSTNLAQWDESAIQLGASDAQQIIVTFNSHVADLNNPHAVTAEQVNTYTKSVINQKVADVDTKITNHINRTDDPHNVTAAQAGAVPTTGGTYTGAVTFEAPNTPLNPGAGDQALYADADIVGFRVNADKFGLRKSDGRLVSIVGSTTALMMSEDEYVAKRQTIEHEYAVPTPDLELDLASGIHLIHGFGTSTFTRATSESYTNKSEATVTAAANEPLFQTLGMRIDDEGKAEEFKVDAAQNFSGFVNRTMFVEAAVATLADTQVFSTEGTNIEKIATSAGGQVAVIIEDSAAVNHSIVVGTITAGVPFKVAYTVDSAGKVTTYLNGVPGESKTISLPPVAQHEYLYFGKLYNEVFLRSAKTWASVLTAKQISTL